MRAIVSALVLGIMGTIVAGMLLWVIWVFTLILGPILAYALD